MNSLEARESARAQGSDSRGEDAFRPTHRLPISVIVLTYNEGYDQHALMASGSDSTWTPVSWGKEKSQDSRRGS